VSHGRGDSALPRAEALIEVKRYAAAAELLGGLGAAEPGNCRAWC